MLKQHSMAFPAEKMCIRDSLLGEPTVAAVLTAVQDVHQIGVAISVREKVVAQKIDLDERCLLYTSRCV